MNSISYKRIVPVIGVAVLLIGLSLGQEESRELLRYQRDSIHGGEWWRLLSGHLVHLGWSHLWLNLSGWLLISWIFGRDFRVWQWVFIYMVGILLIDAGFWWLNPNLQWYVGLSGLLHTGIVAGLMAWAGQGDRLAMLALGLVVVKLVWEQWMGPVPMTEQAAGGPVVVDAHLYGAVAGLLAVIIIRIIRKSV